MKKKEPPQLMPVLPYRGGFYYTNSRTSKSHGKKNTLVPTDYIRLCTHQPLFSWALMVHSSKPVHIIDIMDVTLSLEDLILIGKQSQKNGNAQYLSSFKSHGIQYQNKLSFFSIID
jgi:hypothetical protein